MYRFITFILISFFIFACSSPDTEQRGINFVTSVTGGSKTTSKAIIYDGSNPVSSMVLGICELRAYEYNYDTSSWIIPADHVSGSSTVLFNGGRVEFNPSHEYINDINTKNLPDNAIDMFFIMNKHIAVQVDDNWYGMHPDGVVPDNTNGIPNPDGTPSGTGVNPTVLRTVEDGGAIETTNFKQANIVFLSNTLISSKMTLIRNDSNTMIYSVFIEEGGVTEQYDVFKDSPTVLNHVVV